MEDNNDKIPRLFKNGCLMSILYVVVTFLIIFGGCWLLLLGTFK